MKKENMWIGFIKMRFGERNRLKKRSSFEPPFKDQILVRNIII